MSDECATLSGGWSASYMLPRQFGKFGMGWLLRQDNQWLVYIPKDNEQKDMKSHHPELISRVGGDLITVYTEVKYISQVEAEKW